MENATFRKNVPWMTTGPQVLLVFDGGEWGLGEGWRLCEGRSIHPPGKQDFGVHFHSFIFIHLFIEIHIEGLPCTEHCVRWGCIHEQSTFFDLPPTFTRYDRE